IGSLIRLDGSLLREFHGLKLLGSSLGDIEHPRLRTDPSLSGHIPYGSLSSVCGVRWCVSTLKGLPSCPAKGDAISGLPYGFKSLLPSDASQTGYVSNTDEVIDRAL